MFANVDNDPRRYTLTPAGKKIKLSKSWIKKHNAKDNANDINDFNDVKIIFPEVSKGSRLYSKVLLKRFKPNNPGEFKIGLAASPSVPFEDVKIDLTAPADMKLYASSRGFEGGLISAGKQSTHYAYHLSQMQAFREEDNSQDDFDFAPYVTISTFPDYVAVGGSIQVQRRLQVQYPKRVCQPEAHERWKRFVELMREDVRGLVMYR